MVKGKCKAMVSGYGMYGSFHRHQCSNSAKENGMCGIHSVSGIEAKEKRQQERWDEETRKIERRHENLKRSYAKSFIEDASLDELKKHKREVLKRIAELEN